MGTHLLASSLVRQTEAVETFKNSVAHNTSITASTSTNTTTTAITTTIYSSTPSTSTDDKPDSETLEAFSKMSNLDTEVLEASTEISNFDDTEAIVAYTRLFNHDFINNNDTTITS